MIFSGSGDRFLHPVEEAVMGDLPLQAGGETDEPLGMVPQQFLVDARSTVKPLLVTGGNES
jgi:hypothetical protein